jgi:hypothetical protein
MTREQLTFKMNTLVKVVFKPHDERMPMIGKFVKLRDGDELMKKGMVRFVNQSRLDFWDDEKPSVALTRIYCIDDFTQAIMVLPGVPKEQ